MSSIRSLCRIGQLSVPHVRRYASEQKLPEGLHPKFYVLKENQKLYQKADGIPIHLKRGARDKVLYYLTVGLTVVGLGFCADFVYHLP